MTAAKINRIGALRSVKVSEEVKYTATIGALDRQIQDLTQGCDHEYPSGACAKSGSKCTICQR